VKISQEHNDFFIVLEEIERENKHHFNRIQVISLRFLNEKNEIFKQRKDRIFDSIIK
jgi:hypothetical protein